LRGFREHSIETAAAGGFDLRLDRLPIAAGEVADFQKRVDEEA
jgi:hypothetical protein